MVAAYEQLDKRFAKLKPLANEAVRPFPWMDTRHPRSTGMTTGQLAKRAGVRQPRVIELERGEATGNITVKSLERAAEALGCRLVYALVPIEPLADAIRKRASVIAEQQLAAVEQTMRLEAQEVSDNSVREEARKQLVEKLLHRPARLWDE